MGRTVLCAAAQIWPAAARMSQGAVPPVLPEPDAPMPPMPAADAVIPPAVLPDTPVIAVPAVPPVEVPVISISIVPAVLPPVVSMDPAVDADSAPSPLAPLAVLLALPPLPAEPVVSGTEGDPHATATVQSDDKKYVDTAGRKAFIARWKCRGDMKSFTQSSIRRLSIEVAAGARPPGRAPRVRLRDGIRWGTRELSDRRRRLTLLAMKVLSMSDARLRDRIDAQHLLQSTPNLDILGAGQEEGTVMLRCQSKRARAVRAAARRDPWTSNR